MAGKRQFNIKTPPNVTIKNTASNGSLNAKLTWSSGFGQKKNADFLKAQEFIDSKCLLYMNPLTPRLTGVMIKSGTIGTTIGSGEIEYLAPYARRQYYENAGSSGGRGRLWFERMKASHKEPILKGAAKIAAGN